MREIKKEVVYDFIDEFIGSLKTELDIDLTAIKDDAISKNIPIIKNDVINFIKVILLIKRPKRILEIGTGFGFSSILMAKTLEGATIDTIERDDWMYDNAESNIKRLSLENSINLIKGDGYNVMKTLKGKYDMIFIDASKSHYNEFLEESKRLIEDGGIILADNVLYKGLVAKDRYDVVRRDRTIHRKMREFIDNIYNDNNYSTCLVTTGDGMLLSIKK